jgi:hypothetical protein
MRGEANRAIQLLGIEKRFSKKIIESFESRMGERLRHKLVMYLRPLNGLFNGFLIHLCD